MTEAQFRTLNGTMLVIGAVAMIFQIYWQLDLKLPTWQRRAACLMIVAKFLIMLQYGLAVLNLTPSFALGARGTFTFFFWIGAAVLWAVVTHIDNSGIKRSKGVRSYHLWDPRFWQGMFGDETESGEKQRHIMWKRERVVGKREDVATRREDVVTKREDCMDRPEPT